MSHRVLITGSSGLVGSALCEALEARSIDVERLDLRAAGHDHGDVRDIDRVRRAPGPGPSTWPRTPRVCVPEADTQDDRRDPGRTLGRAHPALGHAPRRQGQELRQPHEHARPDRHRQPGRVHARGGPPPPLAWCNDKGRAAFGRHTAPIISLLDDKRAAKAGNLAANEAVIVVSALIPNRRGQPVLHRFYAARFLSGRFAGLEDFGDLCARLRLGRRELPNRNVPAASAHLDERSTLARPVLPAHLDALPDGTLGPGELRYPPASATLEDLITEAFNLDEPPRFILVCGDTDLYFLERGKWAEQRLLSFDLEEILGRRDPATKKDSFQKHRESLHTWHDRSVS